MAILRLWVRRGLLHQWVVVLGGHLYIFYCISGVSYPFRLKLEEKYQSFFSIFVLDLFHIFR